MRSSPSRRSQRATSRGGNLGLGLYITCEIARAHGGTIKVDSSDQTNTTFIVQLPRN
jgi:signal transduction histidine kinase